MASEGKEFMEPLLSNFSPRVQRVLALARKEAERFNHHFVGTEHVLLGLVRLGQGTALTVLEKVGLDLETLRVEVENQVGTGPDEKPFGLIPYTPRVKKVFVLAAKEAKALHHTYVGTEHILLGLLREGDGVAGRVLRNLGADIEKIRKEILNFSPANDENESSPQEGDLMAAEAEMAQSAEAANPSGDAVDTTQRYDVYCTEGNQEPVVYRNVLFKGTKTLFQKHQHDTFSEFIELEHADGKRIFVAKNSVLKFCETGAGPNP